MGCRKWCRLDCMLCGQLDGSSPRPSTSGSSFCFQWWMRSSLRCSYLETPEAKKEVPQAPEAKITPHELCFAPSGKKRLWKAKNASNSFQGAWTLHGHFCSCKTQMRTKALTNSRTYCYGLPMLSLCNKRCKKNTTHRKQAIQHSIYVFMIAHVKRWFTSALGHLDCSFQQRFHDRKES